MVRNEEENGEGCESRFARDARAQWRWGVMDRVHQLHGGKNRKWVPVQFTPKYLIFRKEGAMILNGILWFFVGCNKNKTIK